MFRPMKIQKQQPNKQTKTSLVNYEDAREPWGVKPPPFSVQPKLEGIQVTGVGRFSL